MMLNGAQLAVIKKDLRETMASKSAKAAMLVLPIMMAMFLPGVFTALTYLAPGEMSSDDFGGMLAMMDVDTTILDAVRMGYYFMMNYMMPMFFVLIPVMTASIVSGSSIVGERERRTLATLLYTPLTVGQMFAAKVLGALAAALFVTLVAFGCYLAVAIVGSVLVYGGFVLNVGIWLTMLLVVAPSVSMVGITLMVLASARAHTFQEAQQYSALLMVPTMLLMMLPQITGLFLFNWPQLLALGMAYLVIGLVLLKLSSARFTAEKLLK